MALAIDHDTLINNPDLFYYSAATVTAADSSEEGVDHAGCNWNAWSPVVDWAAFPGGPDDFHNLMMTEEYSMLNEDVLCHHQALQVLSLDEIGGVTSNSSTISDDSSTDVTMVNVDDQEDEEEEASHGEAFMGLRVFHLLIAAAEAFNGVNKNRELTRVILVRLKELVSHSTNSTGGTNIERIAAHFTAAFQSLLEGGGSHHHPSRALLITNSGPQPTDVLAAFQLLQNMSPYIKFGHFTANQAILEAVGHERRVHIVDYDIMEGTQWASLMQSLVSKIDGSTAPHLRITAILRGATARKSIWTIQEVGRHLKAFAASIGLSFSFHQYKLNSNEKFQPSDLKLIKGEVLIMNCMLDLPHFTHRAPESVHSFLSGAKTLNPRVVTLVEEEVRGPKGDGRFMARFMDTLDHYSAVYDSLDVGFPMKNRARALVERVFLGPRISGSLARICGEDCGDGSFGEWLNADGFRGVPLSFSSHCQAKLLLGLFNDGYRVEEVGCNKLVLGWKSRPLLSASVWALSSPTSSSESEF